MHPPIGLAIPGRRRARGDCQIAQQTPQRPYGLPSFCRPQFLIYCRCEEARRRTNMHFSIPDTQECKEDNGSTYVVSISGSVWGCGGFTCLPCPVWPVCCGLYHCDPSSDCDLLRDFFAAVWEIVVCRVTGACCRRGGVTDLRYRCDPFVLICCDCDLLCSVFILCGVCFTKACYVTVVVTYLLAWWLGTCLLCQCCILCCYVVT